MKTERQGGFILLFVVMIMAVIAVEMFVLTGISNVILFESNDDYLEACQRNLVASGLAWAQYNAHSGNKVGLNKTVDLDISRMNLSRSSLSVTIDTAGDKEATVRVNTSVSRDRQTIRQDKKYRIKL